MGDDRVARLVPGRSRDQGLDKRGDVADRFSDDEAVLPVVEAAQAHCLTPGGKDRRKEVAAYSAAAKGALPWIMSDAFSAIISTQALIWADTMSGMAEASTTRR